MAKLEFESPGGMTGLPLLRPRLREEERRLLRRRRIHGVIDEKTREQVRRLVAAGRSGRQISKELKITLPSVTSIRKKFISDRKEKNLAQAKH